MMVNFKSIKIQLILYLVCGAVLLTATGRDFAFLRATLLAVASALVIEACVLYVKTRTLQITESAIITGFIVGYVLSSDEAWWKFVCACSLAILSKHLIRFHKRHIFNPAAFGIFTTLLFLGAATQWKATFVWPILVPVGIYFSHRIKKVEIIIGYATASLLLFATQALWERVPVRHIFGYFSYFYIFVMLIEPKTAPLRPLGKYLFGAGAAALIFILTGIGVRFDAELFSLLAMNTAVPLLNTLPLKRGGVV